MLWINIYVTVNDIHLIFWTKAMQNCQHCQLCLIIWKLECLVRGMWKRKAWLRCWHQEVSRCHNGGESQGTCNISLCQAQIRIWTYQVWGLSGLGAAASKLGISGILSAFHLVTRHSHKVHKHEDILFQGWTHLLKNNTNQHTGKHNDNLRLTGGKFK